MAIISTVTEAVLCDGGRVIIAIILVVGTLILLGMHLEVPTTLWALDSLAVGFWFGGVTSSSRPIQTRENPGRD